MILMLRLRRRQIVALSCHLTAEILINAGVVIAPAITSVAISQMFAFN